MQNKVSDLQSKLSHTAKQSLDRKLFLKRKYSDKSRGTRRVHDGVAVRLGLYQFG